MVILYESAYKQTSNYFIIYILPRLCVWMNCGIKIIQQTETILIKIITHFSPQGFNSVFLGDF